MMGMGNFLPKQYSSNFCPSEDPAIFPTSDFYFTVLDDVTVKDSNTAINLEEPQVTQPIQDTLADAWAGGTGTR